MASIPSFRMLLFRLIWTKRLKTHIIMNLRQCKSQLNLVLLSSWPMMPNYFTSMPFVTPVSWLDWKVKQTVLQWQQYTTVNLPRRASWHTVVWPKRLCKDFTECLGDQRQDLWNCFLLIQKLTHFFVGDFLIIFFLYLCVCEPGSMSAKKCKYQIGNLYLSGLIRID